MFWSIWKCTHNNVFIVLDLTVTFARLKFFFVLVENTNELVIAVDDILSTGTGWRGNSLALLSTW